jgi:type IV secretory pathway protease TraF
MKITITIEKTKTFLKLCSILCVIILALSFLYLRGYRINVSDSLPHWIYRISDISDKTISRGDYAVVNYSLITHSSAIKAGLERKYLGRLPMLKQIGAVSGDVVLLQDDLLYINRLEFGPMIVISTDSHGNPLSPFPTPVALQSDQ